MLFWFVYTETRCITYHCTLGSTLVTTSETHVWHAFLVCLHWDQTHYVSLHSEVMGVHSAMLLHITWIQICKGVRQDNNSEQLKFVIHFMSHAFTNVIQTTREYLSSLMMSCSDVVWNLTQTWSACTWHQDQVLSGHITLHKWSRLPQCRDPEIDKSFIVPCFQMNSGPLCMNNKKNAHPSPWCIVIVAMCLLCIN